MKTALSYLLTPLFFLFFGFFLGIFHIIQVIALNVFGHKAHDKTVVALNFCLTACLCILGTRLRFRNFKRLPKSEPVLIISNHQSMWDIPPVIWKLGYKHPKYIAKASLAKFIPSISYNLKYGGSVTIDRKNNEESLRKIREFARFIAAKNFAICIYPEGTRSRDGKVKRFKTGGVESILKEIPNILVAPIAIKNTGKIDNHGKFNKKLGVKASFTMLPTRRLSLANLEEGLEKLQNEIAAAIRPQQSTN